MPEGGCGDFVVVSERMGHLILRVHHEYGDLLITFLEVRAFRVHWDGDEVSNNVDRPRSSFLLVENSCWLAGSDFLKNYGPHGWDVPYQHYRVLASERHIDVIARSAEARFARRDSPV